MGRKTGPRRFATLNPAKHGSNMGANAYEAGLFFGGVIEKIFLFKK